MQIFLNNSKKTCEKNKSKKFLIINNKIYYNNYNIEKCRNFPKPNTYILISSILLNQRCSILLAKTDDFLKTS